MKYSAHMYARALTEVIADAKGKEGDIPENFIALVRKNGDERHLSKIIAEAARLLRKSSGDRKITFRSARPLTAAQRKSLGHFAKAGDVIEEVVDAELVAGVQIVVDDEKLFDGSLRKKLDVVLK